MNQDKVQKVIQKLQMLGYRVEVYEDILITASNTPDKEGYDVVTLHILENGEYLSVPSIQPLHKLFTSSTKLIIKGPGLLRGLTVGLGEDIEPKHFQLMYKVKKVVLDIDTRNIESMQNMFYGMRSLEEVEFNKIDTSSVSNMHGMFSGCKRLRKLDLSGFNTLALEDMSEMFNDCYALSELNISSFNTPNLMNLSSTFRECQNLKIVNLRSFGDTRRLGSMESTFFNCIKLEHINLDGLNLNRVITFKQCFRSCISLSRLTLPIGANMELRVAKDLSGMFQECFKLKGVDLSPIIGTNVITASSMFHECTNLEVVTLKNFTPMYLDDVTQMFAGCEKLKHLDIRSLPLINIEAYSQFIKTREHLKLILRRTHESGVLKEYINSISYMDERFISIEQDLFEAIHKLDLELDSFGKLRSEWERQAKLLDIIIYPDIKVLIPID